MAVWLYFGYTAAREVKCLSVNIMDGWICMDLAAGNRHYGCHVLSLFSYIRTEKKNGQYFPSLPCVFSFRPIQFMGLTQAFFFLFTSFPYHLSVYFHPFPLFGSSTSPLFFNNPSLFLFVFQSLHPFSHSSRLAGEEGGGGGTVG